MKKQWNKLRKTYFSENFRGKYGNNAAVSFDVSHAHVLEKERCGCGDPLNCVCKVRMPPDPKIEHMDHSLFKHNRPFLLWTIYHIFNPEVRISFVAKLEQEVYEEVARLNSKEKTDRWAFIEEEFYNLGPKADHKFLIEKSHAHLILER